MFPRRKMQLKRRLQATLKAALCSLPLLLPITNAHGEGPAEPEIECPVLAEIDGASDAEIIAFLTHDSAPPANVESPAAPATNAHRVDIASPQQFSVRPNAVAELMDSWAAIDAIISDFDAQGLNHFGVTHRADDQIASLNPTPTLSASETMVGGGPLVFSIEESYLPYDLTAADLALLDAQSNGYSLPNGLVSDQGIDPNADADDEAQRSVVSDTPSMQSLPSLETLEEAARDLFGIAQLQIPVATSKQDVPPADADQETSNVDVQMTQGPSRALSVVSHPATPAAIPTTRPAAFGNANFDADADAYEFDSVCTPPNLIARVASAPSGRSTSPAIDLEASNETVCPTEHCATINGIAPAPAPRSLDRWEAEIASNWIPRSRRDDAPLMETTNYSYADHYGCELYLDQIPNSEANALETESQQSLPAPRIVTSNRDVNSPAVLSMPIACMIDQLIWDMELLVEDIRRQQPVRTMGEQWGELILATQQFLSRSTDNVVAWLPPPAPEFDPVPFHGKTAQSDYLARMIESGPIYGPPAPIAPKTTKPVYQQSLINAPPMLRNGSKWTGVWKQIAERRESQRR